MILPMVFYKIPQCGHYFPFWLILVGLCNTFRSVKICVIDPKAFMTYPNRVIGCSSQLLVMNNTPYDNIGQNEPAHGVIQKYRKEGILLSFWVLVGLCNTLQSVKR
jgi:hypothetical protein